MRSYAASRRADFRMGVEFCDRYDRFVFVEMSAEAVAVILTVRHRESAQTCVATRFGDDCRAGGVLCPARERKIQAERG